MGPAGSEVRRSDHRGGTQGSKRPETSSVHHPLFARLFALVAGADLEHGGADRRREMLAGLAGRAVEVGAGHGLNFPFYPRSVSEVVAIEPEPYLRRKAEASTRDAPVPVTVVDGLAHPIDFEDGSFDAGVTSLVLCTVPDHERALAELFRVIRPGGMLHYYEHVRARSARLARVQDALDKTIWPHVAGGCHTGRDTVGAIRRAGFKPERHRELFESMFLFDRPLATIVIGAARRP